MPPIGAAHLRATLLPDGDAPVDLWVVDGRLTFVPPPGTSVADLADPGGFVLPGLVDSHTHLTLDFEQADGATAASVDQRRRDHARSGTLVVRDIGSVSDGALRAPVAHGLATVHAAGPFLAPAGRYFGFQQVTPPGALVSAAADVARAGYPWVKVILDFPDQRGDSTANYDVGALREAVAAVHALGARLAVHAGGDGGRIGVEAGVDSIEHGFGLDEGLLARMAADGIAWTPTGVIIETLGFPRPARDHFHSVLAELLPRAEALGVIVLAGTDVLPPGSVAAEVAVLADHGLSPRAALASATTAPRRFLGESLLVEGATADLVLYRHDPRDDPRLLASPELVLQAGERVDSAGAASLRASPDPARLAGEGRDGDGG